MCPTRAIWPLLAAVLIPACAARPVAAPVVESIPVVTVDSEPEWKGLITPADLARIDGLAEHWNAALADLRGSRAERSLAAEMPLLDPAAALPLPAPPPGHYRCRIVRLGDPAASRSEPLRAYKSFSCFIGNDGKRLNFTKETGSNRPAGWFWEDGDTRLVFLGALVEGEESTIPAYGEDEARDLAGVIERVAPFRWRLVLPSPVRESRLDIIELVPNVAASPPGQGV